MLQFSGIFSYVLILSFALIYCFLDEVHHLAKTLLAQINRIGREPSAGSETLLTDQTGKPVMKRRMLFKVEQNRVLVPVGEPCPFGCRYCYTRSGEVGPARMEAEEILSRLLEFAQYTPFETIQFGYDGDPFARPERGIAMLQRLSMMNKHVNFSTKAMLEGATLEALSNIHHRMQASGRTLSALVSLSCWDSALAVEPHTPSPAERMLTVANLKQIGIPVFIAIRPVLPQIADGEYERVVIEGILADSEGFIVGPLYADRRGQFVRFISSRVLEKTPSQTWVVSWSAHAPVWTRYEDPHRLQRLIQMIERWGGRAFQSSADVMRLIRHKEVMM
jgi:DNA repair photolyase